MTPRVIPPLTGLRGFGALWVVLYHVQAFDNGILAQLGYLGVDLFFLLSGLVLTHVHAQDFSTVTAPGYRRFLMLRLARIYPLHACILLLMGAAFLLSPGWFREQTDRAHVFSPAAFLANLVLVQNWVPRFSGTWNLPAWSISIEWAAYLAFPFMMPAVLRVGRAWLAAGLAVVPVAVFALGCIATGHVSPNLILKAGFVRMAAEFTAGCLLCRASALGLVLPAMAARAGIAVLALCVWPLHLSSFLGIPAFMLLLLLAMQGDAPVGRLFGNPLAMFLGNISYSIYLVHWPLIVIFMHVTAVLAPETQGAWKLPVMLMVVPVSYITYRLVELPSRRWGRHLVAARHV